MPDPAKKPGEADKEPFSLGPIPVEAFLTSMFMPIPLVWALHPLKWYNSQTFKLLWCYAAAFLYHHFLAVTLGDRDPEAPLVHPWHFLTAILFNRLVLELNFCESSHAFSRRPPKSIPFHTFSSTLSQTR